MIGLTNLRSSGPPLMAPKLNRRRALFVLGRIDEILSWERTTEQERDTRFVELGRYLCETRAGQYWRVDNLKSFDEFLEKKFPESRRKAYYLMAIHEQLPRQTHRELKQVGWTKAAELAKVARRDGQQFDCATWLHKAQELPKEEFKREVERHLTGQETEPWEMLYFKMYKSQLAVIEQALETASLMLGGQKSRGYCLEMICADFLAGASLRRLRQRRIPSLGAQSNLPAAPDLTTAGVLAADPEGVMNSSGSRQPRLRLDPGFLSRALSASASARWLAMPRMRKFPRSSGTSYSAAKPSGRRCGRKSHHALQCMPSRNPSPCPESIDGSSLLSQAPRGETSRKKSHTTIVDARHIHPSQRKKKQISHSPTLHTRSHQGDNDTS